MCSRDVILSDQLGSLECQTWRQSHHPATHPSEPPRAKNVGERRQRLALPHRRAAATLPPPVR